jgi:predicted XRE-type DNA-binding protein
MSQHCKRKGSEDVSQDEVRTLLKEKTSAVKQSNISAATGIPREMVSRFMHGKRDLYPESLEAIYNYLINH